MQSQVLKEQYMQKRVKQKRKGKLGKQLDQEESQVLDELFGSQQKQGGEEEHQYGNLDQMSQEKDNHPMTSDGEPVVEFVETHALQTSEEHKAYLRL